MASTASWYAVRVASQSQRMARKIESEDFPLRRIGESVVERECRDGGIDVYMPAFWTMHRHHRKKTILEKRYPLFVGYAFVLLSDREFEHVRNKVPSVTAFLRPSRYGEPIKFAENVITRLMLDEFESRQAFLLNKAQTALKLTVEDRNKLKSERRAVSHRISSATRRKKVNLNELARMQMEGMLAEDKARLQALDRELKALENYDESVAKLAKVG